MSAAHAIAADPPDDDLVASYGFDLDPARIAQRPPARRSGGRLMVVPRAGGAPEHRGIDDLPSLLRPGDLIVVNDTRVIPARLTARKATGGEVRLLLVAPLPGGAWSAMVRPSARLLPGTEVTLIDRATGAQGPALRIAEPLPDGLRRIEGLPGDAADRFGEMPLPPYIDRSAGPDPADRERYQTVYAAEPGAVAAPTAGLHLSDELIAALRGAGVGLARVTLHVGPGTFLPVRAERLGDVVLHAESYRVPPETAAAVAACEARGGRLVAVGTTACRALEAWHRAGRPGDGATRSTRLFLHPGDPPRLRASLLTNLHLPGSSLVMLVASFLGRRRALDLYGDAASLGYRFYSYGDAMLLV